MNFVVYCTESQDAADTDVTHRKAREEPRRTQDVGPSLDTQASSRGRRWDQVSGCNALRTCVSHVNTA